MPRPEDRRLEVGRVVRPHGLRGQVVVDLVTNREERLAPGGRLHTADGRRLEVLSASASPPSGPRRRWIVAFDGLTDRSAAEALRGVTLLAEPLDEPGTLWVHELVGATVSDVSGAQAGTVVAVQANPASDLLVLDTGALVPLQFVVSSESGVVVVDVPPGLLDA